MTEVTLRLPGGVVNRSSDRTFPAGKAFGSATVPPFMDVVGSADVSTAINNSYLSIEASVAVTR
ncbi:hypothetical protein [Mycolicibacterium diernhoferi]|uniref:hypothetical protein n=1 Tax=Mycolicibacterium diernhoferi TaxID=1801 RepID=UPI00093FF5C1|nr:hypothetical protein [Mycolicibacterium diernhoferi]OJZ64237.1 hypothetical protein BRW64_19310 [Mycolicibacterium diernhoferi]QYL21829.1 hypothetical protein K0O62_23025 [Mycolicibacterium diernhoferi]